MIVRSQENRIELVTCLTVIAVLTFFIHWSGFFGPKLQPNLSFALWIVAALLGPLLHYVLPQMRKELPWLCFSHPVFKANDYDHFEAKGPTKVMWFERLSLWAQIFEKNVLYPLIFLSALTVDIERIKQLPSDGGHWIGTIILVVTALKTFRSVEKISHLYFKQEEVYFPIRESNLFCQKIC